MEDTTRGDRQDHIIIDSIRRHIVFVLVVAIAFTCAGAAFTLTRHAHYSSTAKVLVQPLAGNPLSPESLSSGQLITVAMTTEAGLVTSPKVVELVKADMLPLTAPPPQAVSAIVPPNTAIVQIRVRASSAAIAAAGAEAYAEAFLAYRESQASDISTHELVSLNDQLDTARAELKKAAALADSKTPSADAATQAQLWASRVAAIQTSIGDLESTTQNAGSVIETATLAKKPDGLNPLLVIAATVVLGLGAGVVLAIWRERRDDRIRTAYDDSVAGIPVLATLPGSRRTSPRRMAEMDADDELRACYRRARAGVIAAAAAPAVLVVSSMDRGSADVDSAGEVAANLGWSLTGAGFAVTIVDATIGHGHVAELLGVETTPGLSEHLVTSGSAGPRTHEAIGMKIVSAGRDPEASREFYAGARLSSALSWFTADSDYVIVAGPPIGTPDGEAVALVGDAVLLVVVDNVTTHRRVAVVLDRITQLGVRVVGAVGLHARVNEEPRTKGSTPLKSATPLSPHTRGPGATPSAARPWEARRAEVGAAKPDARRSSADGR